MHLVVGHYLNYGHWLLTLSHCVQSFFGIIHAALRRMPGTLSGQKSTGTWVLQDISSAVKIQKCFRIPASLSLQYDLHWNRGVPALQILCFIADGVWDQEHITELKKMEWSKQDCYKCTIIRVDEFKQKITIRMDSFLKFWHFIVMWRKYYV